MFILFLSHPNFALAGFQPLSTGYALIAHLLQNDVIWMHGAGDKFTKIKTKSGIFSLEIG